MSKKGRIQKVLWSIILPGSGQILNGKIIKGLLLSGVELFTLFQSHLLKVILYSFRGDIQLAIEKANYQWLMFYPCIYLFSIWDAYKLAGGGKSPYAFLPFVFSVYTATLGVIYSSNLKVFGVLLGPIFLPLLFSIPGIGVGLLLKMGLENKKINS
ncbi:hypothetical protein KHA96_11860 [Bacillus sp. FJAT-49711]|uniref:hypothetical protein n=1 Tax=Bacillus sp. FJAT-49711 TaxID=2833585 RepID=UPI001BC9F20B|nr:hypothetical protein [Bacillus sp. FJAT-49711]MBS4219011.1 hypothetical protein [Bacillus sp. FJAT-49711]